MGTQVLGSNSPNCRNDASHMDINIVLYCIPVFI